MKDLPLISVIVPVYRVENYLDKCVQSIVQQTYKNLEILLVDDGSPDNSGAICDAWTAKDSRIRVIHKENGGAGHARNAAFDIAQGELIGLVDSDDYIEPHMYEHLYSLMEEDVDIAECAIGLTESDDLKMDDGSVYEARVYPVEEAMLLHLRDELFCQTPPNKLYRRETIGDIRFPVGNLIDDEFWTYRVLGNAKKLVRSSCCMYAYRQQPGSAMHKSFSLRRLQGIRAQKQRLEYLRERMPSLVYEGRVNLFLQCLYAMQMSLLHLSGEELDTARREIRSTVSELTPLMPRKKNGFKKNVWLILAQLSFEGVARLQNRLEA